LIILLAQNIESPQKSPQSLTSRLYLVDRITCLEKKSMRKQGSQLSLADTPTARYFEPEQSIQNQSLP
jgi:hypothetical protein